jgi:hypothetical protein
MEFDVLPAATAALGLTLALAGPARADAPGALHETGLYRDATTEITPEIVAFSPQYPLWSDGAGKRRWIALPAGTSVDAAGADWRFPVGTRLWKEFSVGGRRVETRFIQLRPEGWTFTSYVWNDAGTGATRAPAAGASRALPGGRYQIPGEADCRACHEGRATPVLGFSLLQLSGDRDPGAPHAEPGGPDLRELVSRGLLRGLPGQALSRPPRIAGTPVARAALGYLAANCGHCHNQAGPLAGLEMTLDAGEGTGAVMTSTVGRPSRFLPPGTTGDPLRVAPGRPDLSVVATRMRSLDPLVRMPPLGSASVDQQGLALIERWIRETKKENRP